MELKYIKKAGLALFAAVALTSCQDTSDWQPGPDVEEGNMQVYFEPLASYDLKLSAEDEKLIAVNVSRIKTDEAATIKLNRESVPEGVEVPEEVVFKADERTTTIYVNIENMPEGVKNQVKFSLPENMTSPYTAGSSNIDLKVYLAPWLTVASKVTWEFRGKSFEAVLQMMEGTDIFRIPNFMNSGLDFVFRQEKAGMAKTNMVLIKNCTPSAYGWYFFDDKLGDYPEWTPDGEEPKISYMDIQATGGYCTVDFKNGEIYISPTVDYSDGSSAYEDIYFNFTLDFNPFE